MREYDEKILLAMICKIFSAHVWKTRRIMDGTDLYGGGWFMVGIDTPKGIYIRYFPLTDWDLFKGAELPKMPDSISGRKTGDASILLSLLEED